MSKREQALENLAKRGQPATLPEIKDGYAFFLTSDRGRTPAVVAGLDEDDGTALIQFYWGMRLFEMRLPIERIQRLHPRGAVRESKPGIGGSQFERLTREDRW